MTESKVASANSLPKPKKVKKLKRDPAQIAADADAVAIAAGVVEVPAEVSGTAWFWRLIQAIHPHQGSSDSAVLQADEQAEGPAAAAAADTAAAVAAAAAASNVSGIMSSAEFSSLELTDLTHQVMLWQC